MKMINTVQLFPALNDRLVSFLKELPAADWQRQTVARQWVIKDVAAHLLDGNLKRIAMHRDGWLESANLNFQSQDELVAYINEMNAHWVKAARRLSPELIIDLLQQTNEQVVDIFRALEPMAPSLFPVSWAGEGQSLNWFDIAREYTERWIHQQQIRDASGNQELLAAEFFNPFLDISMMAWPYACRNIEAKEGSVIRSFITGEGGGEWWLVRETGEWKFAGTQREAIAETEIEGNFAWKLFSRSIRKEDMKEHFRISGDERLASALLDMVAVMA